MPPNPSSSTGLPNGHVDPLRSNPAAASTAGKYKGLTHTQESFIFGLTKEYLATTREQCLFVLNNEIKLGFCKEGPEGIYHWAK